MSLSISPGSSLKALAGNRRGQTIAGTEDGGGERERESPSWPGLVTAVN